MHTKKSPAFKYDIDNCIEQLRWVIGLLKNDDRETNAVVNAIGYLTNNTTDSPCMIKAADDEPVFVLRAQDATADIDVANWAHRMRQRAANTTDPEAARRMIARAFDALACAAEMREWPTRKLPD